MIVFTKQNTLGQDANGKNVVLCAIIADTLSDFPAANAYETDGYIISMGSVGLAIDTGKRYILDSAGTYNENNDIPISIFYT